MRLRLGSRAGGGKVGKGGTGGRDRGGGKSAYRRDGRAYRARSAEGEGAWRVAGRISGVRGIEKPLVMKAREADGFAKPRASPLPRRPGTTVQGGCGLQRPSIRRRNVPGLGRGRGW